MERAALIFEGANDADALGVNERVKGKSKISLILDLVDEAMVEVKLGVVEWLDAVLATSEWLLSEESGRDGVGLDAERVGGRRAAFLGDGGGEVGIAVDLLVCVVSCVCPKHSNLITFHTTNAARC